MKRFILSITIFFFSFQGILAQESVEKLLIDAMEKQLEEIYRDSGYRFLINTKWIPEQVKQLSADQFKGVQFVNSSPRGYEMVYVTYDSPRGMKKATSQVFIELDQKVPVARVQLDRGDAIDSSKIEFQWVDVTRFKGSFIDNPNTLENKAVGRIIKAGQPILKGDIIEAPTVTAGEYVNLMYNENGINIMIPCVARESKAVGQQIKLMNKESGKTYVGTLLSKSQAKWERTL